MAKKAVELPDPMETPKPVAPATADDLLSQLAGEEIDRLLREAEQANVEVADASGSDAPAGPAGDTLEADGTSGDAVDTSVESADSPPANAADAALQGELDQLFEKLSSDADLVELELPPRREVTEAAKPAAEPTDENKAEVQAQLDQLFEQLSDDPKADDASAATADAATNPAAQEAAHPPDGGLDAGLASAASALDDASATVAPQDSSATVASAPDASTHAVAPGASGSDLEAGERQALMGPAPAVSTARQRSVPWYLLPLVWLNYPVRDVPPATRQKLGMVALLTLANALLLMGYVWLLRGADSSEAPVAIPTTNAVSHEASDADHGAQGDDGHAKSVPGVAPGHGPTTQPHTPAPAGH